MSKTSIFITRDLKKDSPIYQLDQKAFAITGRSLLRFEKIPFTLPEDFDWVFFYSKNGIRFFFDQVTPEQLPANLRYATMGTKSAAYLEKEYQQAVSFEGNGRPDEVIEAFGQLSKGKRIVFARAKNSKQSVQNDLRSATAIDCICYDNSIDNTISIPKTDVAIITSPLNGEAYLQGKPKESNAVLVAIGDTTADYLKAQGINKLRVPKETTEESITELIRDLYQKL